MEDFVSAPWLRRLITVVLLAGLVLLGLRVMLDPFIVPMVWAAILGLRQLAGVRVAAAPPRWPRASLAALIMTTLVSLAVIVPIAWLAVVLRIELIRAYHEMQALLSGRTAAAAGAAASCRGSVTSCTTSATRVAQDPHALGLELRKVTDHSFDQIAHIVGDISRNAVKLCWRC